MIKLSYAITACNEHVELERLLDQLNKHIRPEDEIVVQLDSTATDEVKKVAEKYNVGGFYEYHRIMCSLNSDFATFKNNLKDHCTREFIVFIDADEYLSEQLLLNLPELVDLNYDVDLFLVPRINTVEGLTKEHITKWGWHVNESGWVNYPDYQTRIVKNSSKIKWINKVHERLVGAERICTLPEGYDLVHPKTIEKQEAAVKLYQTINPNVNEKL
jgi:glycosyltransferase involved in cell wall biosynthesis